MLEEINKAIEANLPQQVGKALQNRLKDLEAKEKDLSKANEELIKLRSGYTEYQHKIAHLEGLINQHKELDAKIADLEKLDRNNQVYALEIQLNAEKDKCEFAKTLALSLTKNTNYKRSVMGSMPIVEPAPVIGPNGSISYPSITQYPFDKTTEISEE